MVPRTDRTPPSSLPAPPSPPAPAVASSFRALAGGLTPLDGDSASRHLAQGYQAVTGSPPSSATLELLWAQWALETSRGQAMYGNNFAGIKAGARGSASLAAGERPQTRGSALLSTTEGHGASARRVRDRFRTYATPEEGARDYVGLLVRRYPEAFAALRQGDLERFAAGLQRGRYFTANPESYRNALGRLAQEHRLGPSSSPPPGALEQVALDGLRWALEKAQED